MKTRFRSLQIGRGDSISRAASARVNFFTWSEAFSWAMGKQFSLLFRAIVLNTFELEHVCSHSESVRKGRKLCFQNIMSKKIQSDACSYQCAAAFGFDSPLMQCQYFKAPSTSVRNPVRASFCVYCALFLKTSYSYFEAQCSLFITVEFSGQNKNA